METQQSRNLEEYKSLVSNLSQERYSVGSLEGQQLEGILYELIAMHGKPAETLSNKILNKLGGFI
ncbi:Uncharacterised protein [uncultured archaeon]|nr:Uncharacterised protein [uncultured archaeon]